MGRKRKKKFKRKKERKPTHKELIAQRAAKTLAKTNDRSTLRNYRNSEFSGDTETQESSKELADVDAEAWGEIPGVPAIDSDKNDDAASPRSAPTIGEAASEVFSHASGQTAIQRALKGTDSTQNEVPGQVLDVIGQEGQPLDTDLRRTFEQRMDADFSNVRIHTGSAAVNAAEAIDAKAFTCGNNIVFNSGEYDPESSSGKHLLAHELAHVTQQTEGAISMLPSEDAEVEIDPKQSLEQEADRVAELAFQPEDGTAINTKTNVHIQRAIKGKELDGEQSFESERERLLAGYVTEHDTHLLVEQFDVSEAIAEDMVGVVDHLDDVDGLAETDDGLNIIGKKGNTEVTVIYPDDEQAFYEDNSGRDLENIKDIKREGDAGNTNNGNSKIGARVVEEEMMRMIFAAERSYRDIDDDNKEMGDDGFREIIYPSKSSGTKGGPDFITKESDTANQYTINETKFTRNSGSIGIGTFNSRRNVADAKADRIDNHREIMPNRASAFTQSIADDEIGEEFEEGDLDSLDSKLEQELLNAYSNGVIAENFDPIEFYENNVSTKARQMSESWVKDATEELVKSDIENEHKAASLRFAMEDDEKDYQKEATVVQDVLAGKTISNSLAKHTKGSVNLDRIIIFRTSGVIEA